MGIWDTGGQDAEVRLLKGRVSTLESVESTDYITTDRHTNLGTLVLVDQPYASHGVKRVEIRGGTGLTNGSSYTLDADLHTESTGFYSFTGAQLGDGLNDLCLLSVGGKLALWWKDTGDYPGAAVRIYDTDIIGGGTINIVTSITNSVKPPIESGVDIQLTSFIRKAYDTSDFGTLRDSIAAHTKTLVAGGTTFTETGKGLNWNMNTDGASILFHNIVGADTNSRLEFKTWDDGNEYFSFTDTWNKPLMKIMPNGGNSPVLINDKPAIHTGNYGALSSELEMEKWLTSRPKNLADSRLWAILANNATQLAHPMTGGAFNPDGDKNACELRVDPWGRPAITWRCVGNDTSLDGEGGWSKFIDGLNHLSNYMSVVYFRINVAGTGNYDGVFDHGTVADLAPANGNPYYAWRAIDTLPVGKWLVSVAYLLGSGEVGTNLTAAIWDVSTGTKLFNSTSYKQAVGNTKGNHRTYLYSSNNPLVDIEWWNPIFCEVDGTEPSMRELLGKPNESFLTNTLISDAVSAAVTTIRGEQNVVVDAQNVKITALTQQLAALSAANQELLRRISILKELKKQVENGTIVTHTLSAPTVAKSGSTAAGEVAVLTASGSTFTPSLTDTVVYYWTLPNGTTASGNSISFTNGVAGSVATATVVAKGTTCASTKTSATVVSTPAIIVVYTLSNPSVVVSGSTVAGQTCTLTASGSTWSPPNNVVVDYLWTLPNGTTASGNSISFTNGVAGSVATATVVAKGANIATSTAKATAVTATPVIPTVVVDAVPLGVLLNFAEGSMTLLPGMSVSDGSITFTDTGNYKYTVTGDSVAVAITGDVTELLGSVYGDGVLVLLPGMSVYNGSITFTDTPPFKYTVVGSTVSVVAG